MHVLRSTLNSRKQQVIGAARPRISFWEFFPRFHISSGRKKTVSIAHVEIVALTFKKKKKERESDCWTHTKMCHEIRGKVVFSREMFSTKAEDVWIFVLF